MKYQIQTLYNKCTRNTEHYCVCVLMRVYKNHMIKVKAGIAILQTNYFSAIHCIPYEYLGISLQHLQSGHNHLFDQWG